MVTTMQQQCCYWYGIKPLGKWTVVTGVDLSKMSDAELEKTIQTTNIYARVAPNTNCVW